MVIGCQVQPIPLSAQAGSTVVLALDGRRLPAVGHGGTEYDDPQRGELVFALANYPGEAGAVELTTRVTLLLGPPRRASLSTSGVAQYLSFVDLVNPDGEPLPLGAQQLYVSLLRGPEGGEEYIQITDHQWDIGILPAEVDADGQSITGAPTPLEVWNWWTAHDWVPLPRTDEEDNSLQLSSLESIIPRPSIQVELLDPATSDYLPAWSAIVDISVPDAVVDVVDATPLMETRTTAWLEDLGVDVNDNRTIRVSAIGLQKAAHTFDLVFELKDDTQPLDLGDVTIDVVKITDQAGQPITSVNAALSIH
jgi:hypothetical protein